jgi:hypothetical protein
MKKFMAGMLIAGIAMVPFFGMTAGAPAATPIERAKKASADADLLYQQAKALLTKVQQEAAAAAASLAKAVEDLKIATASGDNAKIAQATDAKVKAEFAAKESARKAGILAKPVEKLKMLSEKSKLLIAEAGGTDPKKAEAAAEKAEGFAAQAARITKNIENNILKPRKQMEFVGTTTIPSTTTSTTQPSPTPVGDRG